MRDLRAYAPDEVFFGMRYADALTISEDGHPVLDLRLSGVLAGTGSRRVREAEKKAGALPWTRQG